MKTELALRLVKENMKVNKGEEILLLGDTETDRELMSALSFAGRSAGADVTSIIISPSFVQARELSKIAQKALDGCDVYVPMCFSVPHPKDVHSQRVAELLGMGQLRMFILPGGTPHKSPVNDYLRAFAEHDFRKIFNLSKALANWLSDKKELHVTSGDGTDFTSSINDIWGVSPGAKSRGPYKYIAPIVERPGELGAPVEGEAWGGPRENTFAGTVVVNGAIGTGICPNPLGPKEPLKIHVEKGRVAEVEGGPEASKINRLIETYENYKILAENSFGTNLSITELTGEIEWDKKMAGTMHIALGENRFQIYPFGTNACLLHTDMVLRNHTAVVDGEAILKDGKLLYEKLGLA